MCFAKDKMDRVEAIGCHLAQADYDIVCLQEVWCMDDYKSLVNYTKSNMPYSYYFYSGLNGSGLCVLSRWPIVETLFFKWPLNGYFYMVHHADWFGGKGVGLLQIDVAGYLVNIYTTHTHAQYKPGDDDNYLGHRLAQSLDTALLIRRTCRDADIAILAGDLNSIPSQLCMKTIAHVAKLIDSYEHHDEESGCGTYGPSRNSYSRGLGEDGGPIGDRIDYIMYRPGVDVLAEVESYTFPLEKQVPGREFSYSDHEAIAVTLKLSPATSNSTILF
ncbi:hypothetical protein AAG570_011067 [Ranatra chinensis]|uniref:sphingomyelin phosphodiesterase n=1 Tax=Ranatra chinensis TaxID=642074 RepID=A0ABD0YJJ8_9HEMI